MKKEMLTLVIGILIGAIIATGVFLVLQNNSSSNEVETMQEMGGERQERDGNMTFDGEAPADLDSENSSTTTNTES